MTTTPDLALDLLFSFYERKLSAVDMMRFRRYMRQHPNTTLSTLATMMDTQVKLNEVF